MPERLIFIYDRFNVKHDLLLNFIFNIFHPIKNIEIWILTWDFSLTVTPRG